MVISFTVCVSTSELLSKSVGPAMCVGYASLMMLINCARNLRQEDDYGEIKTPRETRPFSGFLSLYGKHKLLTERNPPFAEEVQFQDILNMPLIKDIFYYTGL